MRERARLGRLLPAAVVGGLAGLIGLASGGCAARQAPSLSERTVPVSDEPVAAAPLQAEPVAPVLPAPGSSPPAATTVPKFSSNPTIETIDPRLAEALAALGGAETVDTLNAAAAEYLRLEVFDRANSLLNRAIELAPSDAESFAARARVWREWGLPELGLADAHRGAFLAPESAVAHNTLGTILFALGSFDAAAASFERALAVEPGAAWALSNLCYTALMRGDEVAALTRCTAALERAPTLATARNNLALVHASAGRLDDARAAFLAAADRPVGLYNMGIVLMARREYAAAAEVFGTACREAPAFAAACGRAAEARAIGAGRPAGKKQP